MPREKVKQIEQFIQHNLEIMEENKKRPGDWAFLRFLRDHWSGGRH